MIRSILLSTHIIAGTVALALGFVCLVTLKGGKRHSQAGQAYVIAGRLLVGSAFIAAVRGFLAAESLVGLDMDPVERESIVDSIVLLYGALAVLSVLSLLDLESGLASIRGSGRKHLKIIAIASGIVGLGVAIVGIREIADGGGGLAWLAAVIGGLGIETGIRHKSNSAEGPSQLVGHLNGMIDSVFAFLAAFLVLGGGRILEVSVLDGDGRMGLIVAAVLLFGFLVKRWWRHRVGSSRTTVSHPLFKV